MKEEIVQYFTEEEENFANLLIEIGMKRTVAVVLVFFAGRSKASSREIERGTDLRQPEVSIALNYLMDRDWITHAEIPSLGKGRPNKQFRLAVPLRQILAGVEEATRKNIDRQLGLAHRLRTFV